METKTRTPYGVFLLILAVLLLPLLCIKPGYYLYRELEYKYGKPTEEEQMVHAYAQLKDIPYGKYPKDLIALLKTSPEARDLVLDYPVRKDMEVDLSAYDRNTVPLFLQWDPMWGYETYGSSYLAVTGCGPTCLAMVGYYLTGDETMHPAAVAEFAEKNGYYAKGYGSSWTLISEGGVKSAHFGIAPPYFLNSLTHKIKYNGKIKRERTQQPQRADCGAILHYGRAAATCQLQQDY